MPPTGIRLTGVAPLWGMGWLSTAVITGAVVIMFATVDTF